MFSIIIKKKQGKEFEEKKSEKRDRKEKHIELIIWQ